MLTPAYPLTASERTLPVMALDFTTGVLDPRVTFTRSSTGTYTNSLGLIATAAINEPRFDYNSTTLAPKGLMLEEARTNLCLYSQDFRNTAEAGSTRPWIVAAGSNTVTANYATSPAGDTTASRMVFTAVDYPSRRQAFTLSATTAYTFTLYIKRISGSGSGRIEIAGAGVISGVTTSFTATSDWTRVTVTGTTTGAGTASVYFYPEYKTGATGEYLIWGAQLEAGAFATSYIPTVASTVTRSADAAAMTGTNFSSWYSQNAGTFVAGFQTYTSAINLDIFMANSGAPLTNSIGIYSGTSGDIGWCRVSGATQAAISSGVVVANTPHKTAFAYATNDFAISAAGGVVVTDTSGSLPSPNRLTFGANNIGSGNQGMWLRSLAFYNLRLSNAVLQSFAT